MLIEQYVRKFFAGNCQPTGTEEEVSTRPILIPPVAIPFKQWRAGAFGQAAWSNAMQLMGHPN